MNSLRIVCVLAACTMAINSIDADTDGAGGDVNAKSLNFLLQNQYANELTTLQKIPKLLEDMLADRIETSDLSNLESSFTVSLWKMITDEVDARRKEESGTPLMGQLLHALQQLQEIGGQWPENVDTKLQDTVIFQRMMTGAGDDEPDQRMLQLISILILADQVKKDS